MPIGRPTADRFQAVNRLIDERYTAPRPEVVNTAEAAGLDAPVFRSYGGRVYEVPPLPYPRALDLHRLVEAYHTGRTPDDQEAALDGMVRLFRRLCRPAAGPRRWFWRLCRNPFRNASEKEIIALADFFWQCRTGLTLRQWLEVMAGRARASTESTASPSSSGSVPHGSGRTGTRSPGGTTTTA